MPIPKPTKKEKKNDFISRCVKWMYDNDEFDSKEQKLAVCYSQWKSTNENDLINKLSLFLNEDEAKAGDIFLVYYDTRGNQMSSENLGRNVNINDIKKRASDSVKANRDMSYYQIEKKTTTRERQIITKGR